MLKVGDIVRIKSRKEFKEIGEYKRFDDDSFSINGWMFSNKILEHCDKIGVIAIDYRSNKFQLDIDTYGWWWYDWMLVDIRREKIIEVLNA